MTIESTTNRTVAATNGATTVFPVPYYFLQDADLVVLKTEIATTVVATLTLNTDYTVTGAGIAAGGSVTISPAIATGYKITIYRDPAIEQPLDLVANDSLPVGPLEMAFDRGTMIDQRLDERMDRAIRLNDGDISGADPELPVLEAGKYVRVASDGLSLEMASIATSSTVIVSASETVEGIAEIATQTETNTGTDDLRMVTPLKLKTVIQAATYGALSTTAGAAEGPTEESYRNITGAAANLGGVRSWAMKSSTGTKRVVAKILSRLVTATNAAEDAALDFYTIVAGTLANRFSLGAGLYANSLTDKGAGTVNATGLYISGAVAGKLAQEVDFTSATWQSCTTAIPDDDTIPQITEGDQVLSGSFTPKSATSTLFIEVDVPVFNSAAVAACVALFKNSGADAIAAKQFGSNTATFGKTAAIKYSEASGSTAARTYSVRVGPASGTVGVNGDTAARKLGGVEKATLRVREVLA